MLLLHERSFFNPIKRLRLIASYAIIDMRLLQMGIVNERDHAHIVQISDFAKKRIVPLAFRNHLPRILRCSAGVRAIP